jgi:transposase
MTLRNYLQARMGPHLARTGFFKSVHVKSLPAHALRSLIIARKKLVGQRATLENQAQTFPFL